MAATTLNPSDKKNANVVLSGGNLTVTGNDAGGNNWVRSTSVQTGKRYVEITATTVSNTVIGIANSGPMTFPGADANSFGLFSSGAGSINGTFPSWAPSYASGNVVCMAVDLTAKLVWFRVGAGNWNGSGTANPATATEGFDISAYTGSPHYFIVSGNQTHVATVNFGASAFAQTPPAGFTSWDTAQGTASSAVTFSQTASLAGSAPATGTSTLTFAQTATGFTRMYAVGTAAVTFSSTPTLMGFAYGVSDPNNYIQFFPTGTIDGGTLFGAGTSSVTFGSDVAFLTGAVNIAGSTTFSFSLTAAASQTSYIVGSTTYTFSPSTPLLTSENYGSGTTSFAFSTAATIRGIVFISGTSNLGFTLSSNLTRSLYFNTADPAPSTLFTSSSGLGSALFQSTSGGVSPPFTED